MSQSNPRRLTVVSLDTKSLIKFRAPYETVAFHIDPATDTLRVYAQPSTNALDWDVALSLMGRISDPRRKLPAVPSVLGRLQFWEVQLVEYAPEYLLLAAAA